MNSSKVVIDAWFSRYPFPSFVETIRQRAAEFERAHPEYQVNIRTSWWQDLPGDVARAALEGDPPTCASYYTGAAQHARDTLTRDGAPLYTSVEKAIGGRSEILGEPVVVDDLVGAARRFYTIGGELSSMPLTLSTMQLYTNTTMLRRAGIAEVPATWDEVDAACEALAGMRSGQQAGIAWTNDGKFFQHALAQQGGIFADRHNGRAGRATKVDLTCPEMRAYVDWWYSLHKNGHFFYTGEMQDWEGTFMALTDRRIAFRLSSSFDAKYMVLGAEEAGFDIAVTPVPYNGDVPYLGNWIGGDSFWLAGGLDEATQDGALAFMQFVNNARNAAEWHKLYGSAPVTGAAVELLDDEGWFDRHPYFRAATEQLDMADGPATQAVLGAFAQIQRTAMEAMADVLVEGADPAGRFGDAAAKAQRLLDDYHANCRGGGARSPDCFLVDS